jgi:hypothetical protein
LSQRIGELGLTPRTAFSEANGWDIVPSYNRTYGESEKENMKIKTVVMTCSIFLNLILIVLLTYNVLNGYPEARFGKYGRLDKNIVLGRFGEKQKLFILPKGLLVKNVSATGMDYFEPNRFKAIVTSDQDDLVDYTIDQKAAESSHGEYYSADITKLELQFRFSGRHKGSPFSSTHVAHAQRNFPDCDNCPGFALIL